MESLRQQVFSLRIETCEDSVELMRWLSFTLRCTVADLKEKFRFLELVPWLFARCDSSAIAEECIRQVDSAVEGRLDTPTININLQFRSDLETLRSDGVVTPAWSRKLQGLRNAPLDEAPGEEFHRATNACKRRSPHVRIPWILGSVRFRRSCFKLKDFMKKFGRRGKRIINMEYKHYKRVLQIHPSKRGRGVKMSPAQFYRRLYRMDAKALDDFGPVVGGDTGAGDDPPQPPASTSQRLHSEYLGAVLDENKHYSVSIERATAEGDVAMVHVYFFILGIRGRLQKPRLVTTHESARATLPLTVNVQYMDTWGPVAVDRATIFPEADPEWINALDIAPFSRLQHHLTVWSDTASDSRMCVDIFDPRPATHTFAILDRRCPTISVLSHLLSLGWKPADGVVTHSTIDPGIFDGSTPASRKEYLQVLARLPEMLPLCPELPSDQPQAFYRLLLLGVRAEPNLGDKAYRLRLKDVDGVEPTVGPLALEEGGGGPRAIANRNIDIPSHGDVAPPQRAALVGVDISGVAVARSAPTVAGRGPALFWRRGDPLPNADPAPPRDSSSSSSCGDSGDGDNSSSSSGGIDVGDAAGVPWRRAAGGEPRLKCEYYKPKRKAAYRRWIIRCDFHDSCEAKRTTQACKRHGALEPIAYLMVWHEAGRHVGPDKSAHRDVPKPTSVQIDEWIAEHGPRYDGVFLS